MVKMQNLASSAAELIFASGQLNGKLSDSASNGESDFLNILNNTKNSMSEQPAADSKSDAVDGKAEAAESSGVSGEKTEGREEDADKITDSGKNNSKADEVSEENAGGEQSVVMAQELLSIMSAVSQNTQNVQSIQNAPDNGEVIVTEEAVIASADFSGEAVQELQPEFSQVQASQVTQVSQNTGENAAQGQVKADSGQQNFSNQVQSEVMTGEQGQTVKTAENQNQQPQGQQSQPQNSENSEKSGVLRTYTAVSSDKAESQQPQAANTDDVSERLINEDARGVLTPDKLSSEVTLVKVSDGAQSAQQMTSQVADTIAAKITDGAQEFVLKLNPAELGTIEIKIVFENGKAQVLMSCSEASTQRALAANADIIKLIIESNTNQPTSVVVENAADKMGNYEDQRNENEQNPQEGQENDRGGDSEAETMSFIQQLRLGLTNEEPAV